MNSLVIKYEQLPKLNVVGSNPIARFFNPLETRGLFLAGTNQANCENGVSTSLS